MTSINDNDTLYLPYRLIARGDGLQIEFRNNKLEKECCDAHVAEKKYSAEMAERIQYRIDQIRSAQSVGMMVQTKMGRCHKLKGDRKEQYAVDLTNSYRLVFEVKNDVACIVAIVDYH